MLGLTVFEFIARGIPEAFALMLGMHALSNLRIEIKKYIISSLLFAVYVYFERMLPINYGVHTILDIFVMIIIICSINKADIILAIKASLISTIGLFIFEGLNILVLKLIFKDGFETIMLNITLKTVYGLPSLICFTLITIIYYVKKGIFRYV